MKVFHSSFLWQNHKPLTLATGHVFDAKPPIENHRAVVIHV